MSEEQPKYRVKETYQYCDEMGEIGAKSLKDANDMEARDMQIGGSHYQNLEIEPIEYSMRNKLNPLESKVIKYVTRRKDDRLMDLQKAKHCIEMLIDVENGVLWKSEAKAIVKNDINKYDTNTSD